MSQFKDAATEMNLTVSQSPIEVVTKEQFVQAERRIRAIVPGGEKMQLHNIATIAQESILYRIVPGRDMHYWEDWRGQLQKTPDYKYLLRMATYQEQMLSGSDSATIEDRYRLLTADGKEKHGIPEQCIAVECTLSSPRERREFNNEVKQWVDTGFEPKDALEIAKETYGSVGTTAVGVVDPTEKDKKGNPVTPPTGWSYQQWAEKLALKNAINRRYGAPTADEMSAMAYQMARRAMPEHWKAEYADQPIDIQARLADLEAAAQEAKTGGEQMNGEQHRDRLRQNVDLLRDTDDDPIGEDDIIDIQVVRDEPFEADDFARFATGVAERVPFYKTAEQVAKVVEAMEYDYSPEIEEDIFDALVKHANREADKEAAQQERLM
jgi:hypothetical protein